MAYSGWSNLNYLVLKLAAGTTRQQLEAIQPDAPGMLAAAKADDVHGVIVTCKGTSGSAAAERDVAPAGGRPRHPTLCTRAQARPAARTTSCRASSRPG